MGSIVAKKHGRQRYYSYVISKRVNGKPRTVFQQYLGKAEDVAQAMIKKGKPLQPRTVRLFSFGAVAAL